MQLGPRFGTLARFALIVPALAPLPLSIYAPCAVAQQITKPTGTITTRLPTPGPVVARQLANGTIEVRWKAIAGAARYQLTRSVPPAGAQVVATPPDTVYIDANVQAGSQYYYLVAAVDSGGGIGLKSGSQPVTATMSASASLMASSPATTGGTSGGGTPVNTGGTPAPSAPALSPPMQVSVDGTPYPWAVVYFGFTQDGMAYKVERGVAITGTVPSSWSVVAVTGPRPCCWWTVIDQPQVSASQAVVYRVSTVDPAAPSRASTATASLVTYPGLRQNWTLTPSNMLLQQVPTSDRTMAVGQTLGIGGFATSLDTSIVKIDARGAAVGRRPGVAWVITGSTAYSGQPSLVATRILVTP